MAFLWASIPAGPKPEEARGRFPSNAGGGPMVLDIELRPISEGVSGPLPPWLLGFIFVSSAACVCGAPLFTFLVSASRGSSWQRWPMLRLMQRVQGLSCPQRQRRFEERARGVQRTRSQVICWSQEVQWSANLPSSLGQPVGPSDRYMHMARANLPICDNKHKLHTQSSANQSLPPSHASRGKNVP